VNPSVGDDIPTWTVAGVDAEKMKTMAALLRDPNTIHFDPEAVRALGLGDRVVNQGPTNLAYVMNMLGSWTGDFSCLRRLDVRFQGKVVAGDHVTAGGRVTAVRLGENGPEATCEVWLDVAGGGRALAGTAVVAWPGASARKDR
jgi:acyl dehydratase